jgi:hypothetical protein
VCFAIARVNENKLLEYIALSVPTFLMVVCIVISAYCNVAFSGKIDKLVAQYVTDTCIKNVYRFHPERDSLTFTIGVDDISAYIQVNGYKEKILFEFGAFKKLSLSRKIQIITEIENKLSDTFCTLYERGSDYVNVNFVETAGTRKKSKAVDIIKDGKVDIKTYKAYLKRKAK